MPLAGGSEPQSTKQAKGAKKETKETKETKEVKGVQGATNAETKAATDDPDAKVSEAEAELEPHP